MRAARGPEVELARASELARRHAGSSSPRSTAELDHALLAQDGREPAAEQTRALRGQVAALDEEIARKGPLAESALSLAQRVAALEEEILDLTRERDQTALALRETRSPSSARPVRSRASAAGEHAELVAQIDRPAHAARPAVEAELAALGAEVSIRNSVFATLEVLKKEQDFLRGLIGTMIDEGRDAREQVRSCA